MQGFPGFVSMEVLSAFDAWVGSEEFKRAHGSGGGGDLLRGHPQMSTYEVAVERDSVPSDG